MPDRIEFDLTSPANSISAKRARRSRCRRPLPLWRAGRRPRSRRRSDDRRPRRSGRALPVISSASPTKSSIPPGRRSTICRRPTMPATQSSRSLSTSRRRARIRWKRRSPCAWPSPAAAPSSTRSRCRSTPAGNMIGIKPLFSGRSLADGASANFDVVGRRAERHGARAKRAALSAAADRHALSVLQARRRLEFRAGQDHDARRRRHDRHRARQARPHFAAGEFRPLPARCLDLRPERARDLGRVRRRLVCRRQCRHARHAAKSRSTSRNTIRAIP